VASGCRPQITEQMGIVEAIKLLNKHQGEADPVGVEVSRVLEMVLARETPMWPSRWRLWARSSPSSTSWAR